MFSSPLLSRDPKKLQQFEQEQDILDGQLIQMDDDGEALDSQRKYDEILLRGNIFPANITLLGYKSILQSLFMKKKKKHLKKLLAHMRKYNQEPDLQFIKLYIKACKKHDFPIQLGLNFKEWLRNSQNKYPKLPIEMVQDIILYFESCKGFQQDAKRLLFFLGSNTTQFNCDYQTAKPLVMRYIKHRSLEEFIAFFEQLRKNIKFNTLTDQDSIDHQTLVQLQRRKLYFQLIQQLSDNNRFTAAKIIFGEFLKSNAQDSVNNKQKGYNINKSNVEEEPQKIFKTIQEYQSIIMMFCKMGDVNNFIKYSIQLKNDVGQNSNQALQKTLADSFANFKNLDEKTRGLMDEMIAEVSEHFVSKKMRNLNGKILNDIIKRFNRIQNNQMAIMMINYVIEQQEYRIDLLKNEFVEIGSGLKQQIAKINQNPMPPKGLISHLKEQVNFKFQYKIRVSLHTQSSKMKNTLIDSIDIILKLNQKIRLLQSNTKDKSNRPKEQLIPMKFAPSNL